MGKRPADLKISGAIRGLAKTLPSGRKDVKVSHAPDTFGVGGAAMKFGCSPAFVRKLARPGRLVHHRLGKNLPFRQQDMEVFLASLARKTWTHPFLIERTPLFPHCVDVSQFENKFRFSMQKADDGRAGKDRRS